MAKDNTKESFQKKANLGKGVTYLLVSAGIVALLLYVLPVVIGLDVRNILKSDLSLGILRILLGAIVVAYAIRAIVVMMRRCTLEGENWQKGFENMGAIVLGCLANSYVTCTSYLSIPVGTGAIDLQSTLDSILVGGVPLAITLLTWYLLKKKNMAMSMRLRCPPERVPALRSRRSSAPRKRRSSLPRTRASCRERPKARPWKTSSSRTMLACMGWLHLSENHSARSGQK